MLAQCSLHGGPLKIPKGGKATRFPAREQKKNTSSDKWKSRCNAQKREVVSTKVEEETR